MKAYTLRLDDELLKTLKYISIEERKSIKEILLELIRIKLSNYKLTYLKKDNDRGFKEVKRILAKFSNEEVVKFIREDRGR